MNIKLIKLKSGREPGPRGVGGRERGKKKGKKKKEKKKKEKKKIRGAPKPTFIPPAPLPPWCGMKAICQILCRHFKVIYYSPGSLGSLISHPGNHYKNQGSPLPAKQRAPFAKSGGLMAIMVFPSSRFFLFFFFKWGAFAGGLKPQRGSISFIGGVNVSLLVFVGIFHLCCCSW